MSSALKLWELLTPKQHRGAVVLLGMMLIGVVMEMVGIGLVVPVLALMMQRDLFDKYPALMPVLNSLGNPSHDRLVIMGILTLVGIYAVKAVYLGLLSWKQARFVFGFQADLSQRLFATYLRQPYSFHLQRNSAQLIRNTVGQVDESRWVIQMGLLLVAEGLVLLGVSTLLLAVEFLGTIVVVGTLGLAVWLSQRLTRDHILRWGVARQSHERLRLQHLQQGFGGAKDVKVLGREDDFLAQYWTHNVGNAQVGQRQSTLEALPRLWLELLAVVGLAVLVLVMISRGKPIESLLPTLGLFGAASLRLLPSVNRMLSGGQMMRSFVPVIDNLHSELRVLGTAPTPNPGSPLLFKNSLELDHISFMYSSADGPILSEVSLSISRGTAVGFIGTTGAGKSTLVDIILGLLAPTSGTVKVDGIDIQTNLRGWQDQIGYVPQSIYLTDDTLRRNIAFGIPVDQIDENAILRAIHAAQLDQFVSNLPEGLDTMVGERGIRLSGGQRQRIGMARALYHDPPVLVLDEATSSLDTATERDVMEAVRSLRGSKTLLIVTHRVSTVEDCAHLFRLDRGRVVQEGKSEMVLGNVPAMPPEVGHG